MALSALIENVSSSNVDLAIADDLKRYYADPLGFVKWAYPWGQRGELERFDGPDQWQAEFLGDLGRLVDDRRFDGTNAVMPVRMATSSGHGIGKSVLVAWVLDWIMSTRPHCQGTVTANTFTQLQTKTWAQIQRWTNMMVHRHWFTVTGEKIYHKAFPSTWFCSAQSCKEENSEAFAGQHANTSSSFYLFDEASAVPDMIYEVAEGGLTDGEPMIFMWGNPTRNTGKFYRACFGSEIERWNRRCIDSRETKFANQALIAEWERDYGEDSDFFKVRVRGLPPSASELQFIDAERIKAAQRNRRISLPDEPLIAGFDVSGGGDAWNVIRFRRGLDASSVLPVRITGEQGRDRNILVAKCAEVLRDPRLNVAAMFMDSAFGAPIYERLRTLGFKNVHEVNFGGQSPDAHQANYRAYMWNRMKDWLLQGNIPEKDEGLAQQLGLPGYHINRQNKLVLESKQDITERGERSPDDADALALTFAQNVAVAPQKANRQPVRESAWN